MAKVPKRYTDFMVRYPKVGKAYKEMGDAVSEAGPLDARARQLVKIGIAIGAGLEGATHSHVRKAVEAGVTHEEIRHAVLLSTTTLGFPTMMRGMAWVDDVLDKPDQ